MAYSETLAERIRKRLARRRNVEEKKDVRWDWLPAKR